MIKRFMLGVMIIMPCIIHARQDPKVMILGDKEKEAIAGALRQLFSAQQAASQEYVGIVQAVRLAVENPQVKASAQKLEENLRDLVKNFAQNLKLDDAQAAKVNDIAQAIHEAALIQKQYSGAKAFDSTATAKMQHLQSKLSAHMIPLAMAADEVYKGQDTEKMTQEYLASLLVSLLTEFIGQIPKPIVAIKVKQSQDASLPEPVMPVKMLVEDGD